jgi:hypothetical protein
VCMCACVQSPFACTVPPPLSPSHGRPAQASWPGRPKLHRRLLNHGQTRSRVTRAACSRNHSHPHARRPSGRMARCCAMVDSPACQSQCSLAVQRDDDFERCGALLLMPQKRGMHVLYPCFTDRGGQQGSSDVPIAQHSQHSLISSLATYCCCTADNCLRRIPPARHYLFSSRGSADLRPQPINA